MYWIINLLEDMKLMGKQQLHTTNKNNQQYFAGYLEAVKIINKKVKEERDRILNKFKIENSSIEELTEPMSKEERFG